jgi:hypothetical protein
MSSADADEVPAALGRWFVAHFAVDMIFGLALLTGAPIMVWGFLAIFAVFLVIWSVYRSKLHKMEG